MPRLYIEKIQCRQTSESGEDEIQLEIEGEKIWGRKDINEPESVDVDISRKYHGSLTVDLIEHDNVSPNDLLGSITVNEDSLGKNVAKVRGDGSAYDIHYTVKP